MRRTWLIVGGVFTLATVGGLGTGFGLNVGLPEDSADTSLLYSTTTETTVSAYRITTPELFVEVAGEVDVKVIATPASKGARRLTVERRLTWTGADGRHHSESWNGRWLRAEMMCGVAACGALYTLTVPEGTPVRLITPPRTLTCAPRVCQDG
ncbi:hypothetical protein [Nonomuraea roseola]|uniref:Uncharacterized protein n=1 Tax=Nonomuraea roseola TaxID=46179 RepID=A0ABV5PPD5_9ACTN